jgi:hypothetical protein
MYIHTLFDTTRFKAVMTMNLSWVTSWEVWFGGAKNGQYCIIGGKLLQMVLEPLPSLRWAERTQAYEGRR